MGSDRLSSSQPLRLAVVGCGAVTKTSLLPVLAGHERVKIVALIDRDLARARELADAYDLPRVHDDVAAVTRADADGVVLATPPAHHAAAALDLISRGFHIFVEKPMAIRAGDAGQMTAAAARAGVALSVGLYRRLLPVSRLLRGVLDAEMLGRPLAVDIEEGGEYTWGLATLSVLTREGGGGGVLIDIGTHLLDQLLYVLPGGATVTRYADNARGGIETDCELCLSLQTRWGAIPARMELSRTRQLRGSIRVECEHGTIELLRGDFMRLQIHTRPAKVADTATGRERPLAVSARWAEDGDINGYQAFRAEFDDWLDAIRSGGEPQLSGRSVVPVVEIVEASYANPVRLEEPWVDGGVLAAPAVLAAPSISTGARPRVLVTGAGGFLGCRTVECLHLSGQWDVRALVRRPASAARLARLPIELVVGDVTSADDMARAVAGCDSVVHCAVGTGWPPRAVFAVTVGGTRTVADAARRGEVRRFVHISSMAVHGNRVPLELTEEAPLEEGSGFGYSRAKYLAERAVAEATAAGLRAISLRPARIYGPHSRTFTTRPLTALVQGRLVLAGDADSPANMVFVDNVVEAIACALRADDGEIGEAFLVSEPDQLSWREFYGRFASAGVSGVKVRSRSEPAASTGPGLGRRWVRGVREIVLSPELRGLAKKILWTDPVGTLPRRLWDRSPAFQRQVQRALGVDAAMTYREPPAAAADVVEFLIDPTTVVFAKASTRLGYRAIVPRDEGLALTRTWAAAARLYGDSAAPCGNG